MINKTCNNARNNRCSLWDSNPTSAYYEAGFITTLPIYQISSKSFHRFWIWEAIWNGQIATMSPMCDQFSHIMQRGCTEGWSFPGCHTVFADVWPLSLQYKPRYTLLTSNSSHPAPISVHRTFVNVQRSFKWRNRHNCIQIVTWNSPL